MKYYDTNMITMTEQVLYGADRFDEIITRSFRGLTAFIFLCGGIVGYQLGRNNTPKTLANAGLVLAGIAGYLVYRCPSEVFIWQARGAIMVSAKWLNLGGGVYKLEI